MGDPSVPLTGRQKNGLHKVLENRALSPDFAATGAVNPHLRVFVASFDGTTNNCHAVPAGAHQSLVATLEQSLVNSPVLESHYYAGVATRSNYIFAMYEKLTGAGCEAKAEQGYDDLVRAAERWRREDPLAQVHVHVMGFSRGAATALHFMNLVDRRGLKPMRDGHFQGRPVPKSFAPGAVKTSAVLFDVVSTGQDGNLELTLASTALSVLHIVAGSEERPGFELTPLGTTGKLNSSDWSMARGVRSPWLNTAFLPNGSFMYKRLHQIAIDGARHSDIGDTYGEGYIGRVCQHLALEFQASLGLPVPASTRPTFSEIQSAFGHDSRYELSKLTDELSGAGTETARERAKRRVKPSTPAPWNGDLIQTASLSLVNQNGFVVASSKTRIALPHTAGAPLPTDKDCSKRHRGEYRAATPDGQVYDFNTKTKVFSIEPDDLDTGQIHLKFNHMPIDDLGSPTSLFKRILEREPGLHLKIDISYKKQMAPLANVGQKIAPGQTMGIDATAPSPDPWPQTIRACIKTLNEYPDRTLQEGAMTQAQAQHHFAQCIDSVACTLKQEFALISKVRVIAAYPAVLKHGETGTKRNFEVAISCAGSREGGAAFNLRSKCMNATEVELKNRMQALNAGLNLVVQMLREEGFEVAKGCEVTLEMPVVQSLDLEKPSQQGEVSEDSTPRLRA